MPLMPADITKNIWYCEHCDHDVAAKVCGTCGRDPLGIRPGALYEAHHRGWKRW